MSEIGESDFPIASIDKYKLVYEPESSDFQFTGKKHQDLCLLD